MTNKPASDYGYLLHYVRQPCLGWVKTAEYAVTSRQDADRKISEIRARSHPADEARFELRLEPTLIEILNNPETRRMVEAIEDTQVSLRGREDDPHLAFVLEEQIAALYTATGFWWGIDNPEKEAQP